MPTTYLLSQKQNSIFRHQNREVWLLSIEHRHCGEGHWPWRQGDPGCVPMPPATTECLVLALQPSHCTSDVAWSQSCASPFWPSLELFPEVFSAPLSRVSQGPPHTWGGTKMTDRDQSRQRVKRSRHPAEEKFRQKREYLQDEAP